MTYIHQVGDLVFVPSNVSLLKESSLTLPDHSSGTYISHTFTTNEPDYALVMSLEDMNGRYMVFWNGENWLASSHDLFPVDFSSKNRGCCE